MLEADLGWEVEIHLNWTSDWIGLDVLPAKVKKSIF